MSSIGCPMCCRHDFISVVALHDHLLYYVYRPVQCVICNTYVGGIQELTHHLERHLGDSLSTDISQPKSSFHQTEKSRQSNQLDSRYQDDSHGSETSKTFDRTRTDYFDSPSKRDWNRSIDNEEFLNQSTRDEPIELTLRAFFCQTCGAKVVGKDNYFTHIKQHISRPSNDIPSCSLSSSSLFHRESTSPFCNDGAPSSPMVASENSNHLDVLTDSETITTEETRGAAGSPEAQLSDCVEENQVANQLLKLREWQLGKHGSRFRKHKLSFCSSPMPSNNSRMSGEILSSVSPLTIIDPGSVENPLSHTTGPDSVGNPALTHTTGPDSVGNPPSSHTTGPNSVGNPALSHTTGPDSVGNPPLSHTTDPDSVGNPPLSHTTGPDSVGNLLLSHTTGPGSIEYPPSSLTIGPGSVENASSSHMIGPGSVENPPSSQMSFPGSVENPPSSHTSLPGSVENPPLSHMSFPGSVEYPPPSHTICPDLVENQPPCHTIGPDLVASLPPSCITDPDSVEPTLIDNNSLPPVIEPCKSPLISLTYAAPKVPKVNLPDSFDCVVPLEDCIVSPLVDDVVGNSPGSPNVHDIASLDKTKSQREEIQTSLTLLKSIVLPQYPFDNETPEVFILSGSQEDSDISDSKQKQVNSELNCRYPSSAKPNMSSSIPLDSSGNILDENEQSNTKPSYTMLQNVLCHVPNSDASVLKSYQDEGGESSGLSIQLRCIENTKDFVSETLTHLENLPTNNSSNRLKSSEGIESNQISSEISNAGDMDTFNKRQTKSVNDSCEEHPRDSKPYLHKKFHHDQERSIPVICPASQDANVSGYIPSYQSLLVKMFNGTLSKDVPLKSGTLPTEINKNMVHTTKKKNQSLDVPRVPPVEYTCEVCDVKFQNRSAYRLHYKIHEVVGEKNFVCTFCNKKFLRKRTKDIHLRKHTGEKSHNCGHCSQIFTKLFTLKRHEREVHAMKKQFVCAECSKEFSSQRMLQNHIEIHRGEKSYKCSYCDHVCFTASGLSTHKFEVHSNTHEKTYKCDECNESFKRSRGLKRHKERKHSNQQMPCGLCKKVYSCNEDLVQHRKTHNRDLFHCEHCDKTFTSSYNLQRHSVVHKPSTHPYQCNKCSATFTRLDSLKNHLKLHSQKKVHVCHCGKRFVKKSHLDSHQDKHRTVPKYNCSDCNKAFKFKVSLKNHSCKIVTG